ncbi:Serine-type D-Ala-D-Ala carboxypeptidase [Modestobacter italicus]|uniref:Serine-type D-Ala-D-Ala carboxypeptidase n=1 Tax=Modestobacter italicus (strain DSM 44449 / CECT 9708 / BC 501) TaxID=2732864 RepID=I4ETH8_MODI5|nr:serine hydrolase domain-containing protein [Modestobacter marinus]CCH86691.1 Serine-type D-Ala-D-Ala carboxypeptidase [Modestobacter marinus]
MRRTRRALFLVTPLVTAVSLLGGPLPALADAPRPPDVAGLQSALTDLVQQPGGPPGAIVTLGRAGHLDVLTAGAADLATGRPPAAGDAMRVASVAKAFNAATALSLVSRGDLSLDETVGGRRPDLPHEWWPVTLRQLLGHTSGIPDFSRGDAFVAALLGSLLDPPPPRRLLSYVDEPALLFPPGTEYRYSNSDNVVAGLMIEAATGRSYADVLESQVLRPAGLTATSLPVGADLPAPYVHGYDVSEQPPEDVSAAIAAGWAWASGGVVSTPADLARFIGEDVRGAFTDRRTRHEQFDFRPGSSEPPGPGRNSAGLGLFRYETRCGTVYGHTGNTAGYTQFAAATGDGRRTVTVSVNGQITPSGAPELFEQVRAVYEMATCAAVARHR